MPRREKMTLHKDITIYELTNYCWLCHEYRIRSVHVDNMIVTRIKNLIQNNVPEHLGIKFKVRQ